jgi:hypothetical protein
MNGSNEIRNYLFTWIRRMVSILVDAIMPKHAGCTNPTKGKAMINDLASPCARTHCGEIDDDAFESKGCKPPSSARRDENRHRTFIHATKILSTRATQSDEFGFRSESSIGANDVTFNAQCTVESDADFVAHMLSKKSATFVRRS